MPPFHFASTAIVSFALLLACPLLSANERPLPPPESPRLEPHQRNYSELRFGAFIHFNMGTFTGMEWTNPKDDPRKFAPAALDCGQWADAFKAAGMTYAVLTAKHHDGFCLWDSKLTDYTSAKAPFGRDVLREFVDKFRERGMTPAIYFSIWDRTAGIELPAEGQSRLSREKIDFVKGQLTELLTGYGKFPIIIIDGWAWKMGHQAVPYQEIREHIKKLQPGILICDHNGQVEPWENDVIYFEEPKGIWCPKNNVYSCNQGQTISNGWFWHPSTPKESLMSAKDILSHLAFLESRWCNFLLNCPPNREGLLDENIVSRLAEVGRAWKPDASRPPLPAQPAASPFPLTPIAAVATSGDAAKAIDGINDVLGREQIVETLWKAEQPGPQSVTLELDAVYERVDQLTYFPAQDRKTAGYITDYRVLVSEDGHDFREVAAGKWPADARFKIATFPPVRARYVRLEALAATGGIPFANEIGAGARDAARRAN